MDADTREPLRVGFEGVEDRQRLGVEHTDDNVCPLVDVFQYRIGLAMFLGQRRVDRRRVCFGLICRHAPPMELT